MYTTLISTNDLAANLGKPDWVILDGRFDLAKKSWGGEEYNQVHITGAVFADLEKDLCGPITPTTGRHPLPDPDKFIETICRLGVNQNSQVVVYDTSGGGMAGRLWWQLKYFGHEKVALLDGSLTKWLSEGKPVRDGIETNQRGNFDGKPNENMVATTQQVKSMLGSSSTLIVDSRSPERYRGEVEPIDPVAGRIPGAINRFYNLNLGKNGCFLSPAELKSAFLKLLGGLKAQKTVFYCGSGTTACHNLVAMAHAGLEMPILYSGSWSEWIRDVNNPVEKG